MPRVFNLPLVNAHTHAAMVAFRGLAEDIPLNEWLSKYIWPIEKSRVTAEFIYKHAKKAIAEMQKNGIMIFSDMYFFEEKVARAAEEMRMNAVIGEAILDFPTPSSRTPREALETTEKLIEKYKGNPYISVAVAPHSIYTVSAENIKKAKKLARKHNTVFHMHLAETKNEFDECLNKHKKTPTAYLDGLGVLDDKTILAHCVWLTDEDIDILAEKKSKVVHCPLSNLKLGAGIAPIVKMLKKGIIVSLGTDGAASSNRLDIWEAGKMAVLLQKGINHNPAKISAKDGIKMMTVNGLKALGINKLNGKLISEIEKEFKKEKNYNVLYELNAGELEFNF